MQKTLYDKIWDAHLVETDTMGNTLLYIDRQLVHEVTSPQAFESLKIRGIKPWRSNSNFAVPDHNVPTVNVEQGIQDPLSKIQVETLAENCQMFSIPHLSVRDKRQGIVHVMGPEQGLILPGMTVVCGDSHTATHGAFGALAFGIGTSQVEHVLATQCLVAKRAKNMRVSFQGEAKSFVVSKDYILHLIGKIGTAGGTGHIIEYQGDAIEGLSMEARMTICNMSIEAGAVAGLMAYDQTTCDYLKDKPYAPNAHWKQATCSWKNMHSDSNAHFDKSVSVDVASILPQVTWGTSPEMVVDITQSVPTLDTMPEHKQGDYKKALNYMAVSEGKKITDITINSVFIGSCTNSRIEDLRLAADVVRGKKVHRCIKQALVVPGSGLVRLQAEKEGLDTVFKDAGFEWRHPGCSMCLAMNADRLAPGERCASTSNRNFEGRQGKGGRTHLVNPAMAAAAAVAGRFIHPENL